MKSVNVMQRRWALVAVACLLSLWVIGCQSTQQGGKSSTKTEPALAKGGAQLWSENCSRCHNVRSPSERSDAGWDIITHHMRVRANLTAQEHRAIRAFLKSAN